MIERREASYAGGGRRRPTRRAAGASALARAIGAAGVGLMAASSAYASTDYLAEIGGNVAHDDNLFRQDKDLPTRLAHPGDDIYSLEGNADAKLAFGNYKSDLQLSAGYNWYRRNTNLDNFGYTFSGNLSREQDGIVGLSIDAQSRRQISSFADTRDTRRNIQTLNQISGVLTVPITPTFRVVLTPAFVQGTNSGVLISNNDYRQYGGGVGLGYFTPLGNSVAVTVTRRQTDGLEDRFVFLGGSSANARINDADTSVDLRLVYNPSPITRVDGIISYLRRNDRSALDNDFRGASGRVTFSYMPRDTLQAQLTLERRPDSPGLLFIDSLRTDRAEGRLDAGMTARWRLSGVIAYQVRHFSFDPISGINQPGRTDKDWTFRLQNTYTIAERAAFTLSVGHDRRRSTADFSDFHSTTVQLSVSVLFGNGDRSGGLIR